MHIFFYKLTCNFPDKKTSFIPVQSGPGGLQDLNMESDFNFFFKYVNNIKKEAYSVL